MDLSTFEGLSTQDLLVQQISELSAGFRRAMALNQAIAARLRKEVQPQSHTSSAWPSAGDAQWESPTQMGLSRSQLSFDFGMQRLRPNDSMVLTELTAGASEPLLLQSRQQAMRHNDAIAGSVHHAEVGLSPGMQVVLPATALNSVTNLITRYESHTTTTEHRPQEISYRTSVEEIKDTTASSPIGGADNAGSSTTNVTTGAESDATPADGPRNFASFMSRQQTSAAEIKEKIASSLKRGTYNVEDLYNDEGLCQSIARNESFHGFTFVVIIANTIWIAIDTDYNKAPILCQAALVFQIVDNLFCAFFNFEILTRFFSFRSKCDALRDAWFVFDGFLVGLMTWETWIMVAMSLVYGGDLGGGSGTRTSSVFRVFRVFRLSRIARMARLFRSVPELALMAKGMMMALRSVFVTLCMLLLVIYIFAILFVQTLSETKTGAGHFENVPQAMNFLLLQVVCGFDASFFTAMLDMSWLYYSFYLLFLLIGNLTIMNMLIGILCQVVSDVAEVQAEEDFLKDVELEVGNVLQTLDQDGSESLTADEFEQLFESSAMIQSLQDLGVDIIAYVDFVNGKFHKVKELPFSVILETVVQFRGSKGATVKDLVDMRKAVMSELSRIEFLLKGEHAGMASCAMASLFSPRIDVGE